MESIKESSVYPLKKNPVKRTTCMRPKNVSLLEEDFVLEAASNKELSGHYSLYKSQCISCYESFSNEKMIFINCKLRGYRRYNHGAMNKNNVPMCCNCFDKWKSIKDTCIHCRGPCCKQEINKKDYPFKFVVSKELIDGKWIKMSIKAIPIRFNKKKKKFRERKASIEMKSLKKKKKLKKALVVELLSCGFNKINACNLVNECIKYGVKLKIHLWRNKINKVINEEYK